MILQKRQRNANIPTRRALQRWMKLLGCAGGMLSCSTTEIEELKGRFSELLGATPGWQRQRAGVRQE